MAKTTVKLVAGAYELISVERNADNEMTDFVLARDLSDGTTSRLSCVLVVDAIIKGNFQFVK